MSEIEEKIAEIIRESMQDGIDGDFSDMIYTDKILSLIQIEVDCPDYENGTCTKQSRECSDFVEIHYRWICKNKGKITKPVESGDEGRIL